MTEKRENISVGFEPRDFQAQEDHNASLSYPLD